MTQTNSDTSSSSQDGDSRESRVEDIAAQYADRLIAGGKVDPEEILAAHPTLGHEVLEHLEVFVGIGAGNAAQPLGTLGDYTLRRQIGRGGMGVVYEAWENSMDRRVALKVLPAGIAADEKAMMRFIREAQIAGRLGHPNVVSIYGMGVKEQTPYYAMEYVEGETLAQVLAKIKEADSETETPFGPKDQVDYFAKLARCFADVADGLQHAHSKGIVHRDIKPSNLIFDREVRLRILDFGLARLEGQESLTISGDLVGTPLYMSPEQARRKKIPVDHRTDVYSLGATLYEILTHEPPFRGKDHEDTLSRIIEEDPAEPRKLNPRIPKNLETIVLKCLRKEAGDRYGTAEAQAQDLRRFVRDDPIEARPEARWERLLRRAWRHRFRVAAWASIFLLIIASGLLVAGYQRESQRKAYELYKEKVLGASIKLQMGQTVIRAQSGGGLASDPWHIFTTGDYRAREEGGALRPLERALEETEEAIRIFPRKPDAHYQRAKALLLLGRDADALRALDLAIRCDASFIPGFVLRAVLLEKRGNHAAALRESERATSSGDERWAAAWSEAYTAATEKRWDDAAEAYGKLIALEAGGRERTMGSSLEARLGRGAARLESKNYVEAVDDFSAAMALWPDLVEPALLKGKAYFLMGNENAADRIFEETYKKATFPDEVAQVLVILYAGGFGRMLHFGDSHYEKALYWAEQLKESVQRENLRSACLRRLLRLKEAEAAARKALELDPKSANAYGQLGSTLMREHRLKEAVLLLQKAIELDPPNAVPHLRCGFVLSMQGKLEEATAEYRKSIDLDPDGSAAHQALSEALRELGRPDEALVEAEIALKLTPAWCDTYRSLGGALAELGRYGEAAQRFQEALDFDPESSETYELWGIALENEGKLADALEKYRRTDVNHEHVGRVFEREGRQEEALLEYAKAIQYRPHYDGFRTALPPLLLGLKGNLAVESALEGLVDPLEGLLLEGEDDPRILQILALARLHGGKKKDPAKALEHIEKALEKGGSDDPDALSVLAEAKLSTGRGLEAARTLEQARALKGARRYLVDQLEEVRRQLRPDLASYASIDALLVSLGPGDNGQRYLAEFRGVATGDDAPQRIAYLEARLLERAGNRSEAAKLLEGLLSLEEKRPEPVLRLAELLRTAGNPEGAESELRRALERDIPSREVWDFWASVSLLEIGRTPASLLRAFPAVAPGSYGDDLQWLFQRLEARDLIRIHSGGEEFRDADGALWGRDRFFLGGNAVRHHLKDLREEGDLRATERSFAEGRLLPAAYRFPLPQGAYRVTLYFLEARFHTAGRRRFDVLVEGKKLLKDYEPFAAGFGVLDRRSFETRVDDGALDIELVHRLSDPVLSGLEIEVLI